MTKRFKGVSLKHTKITVLSIILSLFSKLRGRVNVSFGHKRLERFTLVLSRLFLAKCVLVHVFFAIHLIAFETKSL